MLVTAVGPGLENHTVNAQLRDGKSGTEVVTVRDGRAVVHAPNGLGALSEKIRAYANEDTPHGAPRFQALVARLEAVEVATIEDMSLGEIEQNIPDGEHILAEIWMPGGRNISDEQRDNFDEAVREFASLGQLRLSAPAGEPAIPIYRGPERDVHLVSVSGAALKALPKLLPSAVEVHRAPRVNLMALAETADEAGERVTVQEPGPTAAAVAIHDSGVSQEHPYIKPILLGASSVVPGAPSPFDADGHGTQMAGVAAYSQLATGITQGVIIPDAWLVSVRLLETEKDKGGDPERGPLWAERTQNSIATAEALAPQRTVIHNISIGADNDAFEPTDRTAWSVGVDVLAWNSGQGRAFIIAAGNVHPPVTDRAYYPYVNLGPPFLQQPGQAWNALTVGGYTNLDQLTEQDLQGGYPPPLAVAGTLSPHSRTAPGGNYPLKPDLVMEAGNTAPGYGLPLPEAQGLTVLTLDSKWPERGTFLRRTWATSPAAAAASNALARIANAHPDLRPASWRGLLVHTTAWPQAARDQLQNKRDLLRAFGYGVPAPERALTSDSNRPVMVYEGVNRPSHRNKDRKAERLADFIELPLPYDELDGLDETPVTLAVTLSYFIEPTDNLTKRAYAGGRLKWDLQGPTGSVKPEDPTRSGRTSFSEILLTQRLRSQIRALNRDQHGRPWLDEERIDQAVAALSRIAASSLLEANQTATELLLDGFTVEGLPDWDGGRDQRVQYIDWSEPLRNDFVVVSQFRVDVPGTQGRRCIVPDEVLFVNGIPVALVECKKPGEGLAEAVRQHQRYADRRRAASTAEAEGNPRLFHTMQLLVATSGDRAMLGSITSGPEHYVPWRDPYPLSTDELAERLAKKRQAAVSAQDILVGVVLDPVRLLDIVHNYVTFMQTDEGTDRSRPCRDTSSTAPSAGRSIVCRHGKTRKRSGDDKDQRGGIIWHTQGSGKSLTMSFLVRTLRTVPSLRTIQGHRGNRPDPAAGPARDDHEALRGDGRRREEDQPSTTVSVSARTRRRVRHDPEAAGRRRPQAKVLQTTFSPAQCALPPELNTDESIVVLIDEAHRSHTSQLHANPYGCAAELRPDRVHRHAHRHGNRGEADQAHLRRLHRPVPSRRRRASTGRSSRSSTRGMRRQGRGTSTAATWTRSSRTCSPTTPRPRWRRSSAGTPPRATCSRPRS